MFGKKCPRCNKNVSKKFEFCPFCSFNLRSKLQEERDYGFLGKEDIKMPEDELLGAMPLPFRMMLKPLMNELNKQMGELNRELAKEQKENNKTDIRINGKPVKATSFKIHFGFPGQMPIELKGIPQQNKSNSLNVEKNNLKNNLSLPKININDLKIANKLPKQEPETSVRRLSDSIIYEIKLPGVNSIASLGISKVAAGFEIKAFSKKELFVKHIDIDLKLFDFYLDNETLILEFENSK